MFPFMVAWTLVISGALASKKFECADLWQHEKARCGYLFPIRVVGVIRGACAFFFGSYSLRKRLVLDLIITRNS